jgi:hypothetical protein
MFGYAVVYGAGGMAASVGEFVVAVAVPATMKENIAFAQGVDGDDLAAVLASHVGSPRRFSAPALAPLGPGPGLVDLQRASGEVLAIESGDSRERVRLARHLHEAETPGRTGKQLAQQLNRFHFTERFEQLSELRFSHFGRKVANKNIHLNS